MIPDQKAFGELKSILEHISKPEQIDSHPWVESLFVQEAVQDNPGLAQENPGTQLIAAISALFADTMPSMPPKRGKRLDPRWGEFGLIAAMYFVPHDFGLPVPATMRDAWGKIDEAIALLVQRETGSSLGDDELLRYRLVSNEPAESPASTLSDWHRKGLKRLLEAIIIRERYLESSVSGDSSLPASSHKSFLASGTSLTGRTSLRSFAIFLVAGLLLLLTWGGIKAYRLSLLGKQIYTDFDRASTFLSARDYSQEALDDAGILVDRIQNNLINVDKELAPLYPIANRLGWVPVYGGDLQSAERLMRISLLTLDAVNESRTALLPVMDALVDGDGERFTLSEVVMLLEKSQPELLRAHNTLQDAILAREEISAQNLSPRVRTLLEDKLDPVLSLMDDGLSVGVTAPHLLGTGSEGPKTYLLLVENEDELRPTGGFITAVGNLVVLNGRVISLTFEDSGLLEDWDKPYPTAPWQLQAYMNSPVLVLRDSNWYVDFPTAALYAEYLYSYTHAHSVDGVIAFDQELLVQLLAYLGPIEVEGAPGPVNTDNVIPYMRAAKVPPPEGFRLPGEDRKEFIGKIADAVLGKILEDGVKDWEGLGRLVVQVMEERHLLLQFDDPRITEVLRRHQWDGSMQAGVGDYLAIVDTNIGFNKTNAVVTRSLVYEVDLVDLSLPRSFLSVTHSNHASPDVPCIHWDRERYIEGNRAYPIDRCYWNYFRVYLKSGTIMESATPHEIPGEWMILGQDVPAQVDTLQEELSGIQGFGSLLVVPGGESVSTNFSFALPANVVSYDPVADIFVYRLKIKKQPGTLAPPLTLRVDFSDQVVIRSVSADALVENAHVLIETNLKTDLDLEIVFQKKPN